MPVRSSPEAKADVEQKVATMIEAYKNRLAQNDWLTPETVTRPLSNLMSSSLILLVIQTSSLSYSRKVVDENLTFFWKCL